MQSAAAAEAKALLASGRASAAAAVLAPVLAKSPRWGRGWLLLGQARAREGDHDAAATAFKRASGDCTDSSPALTLAAKENFELCLARVLPSRHTLAWLHDAEREAHERRVMPLRPARADTCHCGSKVHVMCGRGACTNGACCRLQFRRGNTAPCELHEQRR
jgi:hypothetical protein